MSTATVFLVLLTLIVIGVCVFVIARTVGKNRGINVVSDSSTENSQTIETEVTTSTEAPTTVVPFTFPTTETPVEPTSSPHIDTSTPPTLTPTVTTTVPPTEPTDTPTVTPTDTPTVTPTDTPTVVPTETPTITPTETPIPTMDRVYFGVAPQPSDFLSEVIGSDQSKCTLSYYVPEVIVEGAPAISEKIKSQCVARIDRIIEEINDSYNAEDVHGEESFFIKYLYFKSSKNTVSVIFTYPIFAGKAGGTVNRVRSLNVDIRTGESVDLNSFITDSRQFSSSIRSALLETGADNINANVMNYKAWYIDGTNGLTVMFNPGTVVPTAYSIISVKVTEGYSEPD